jgi:hypothetical protein
MRKIMGKEKESDTDRETADAPITDDVMTKGAKPDGVETRGS